MPVQQVDELRLKLSLAELERIALDHRGEIAPAGAIAILGRPVGVAQLLVVDQRPAGAADQQENHRQTDPGASHGRHEMAPPRRRGKPRALAISRPPPYLHA